jgi:hypothetical protein
MKKKLFYFIVFVVSFLSLNSCYTEKKAVKQVNKAILIHRDTVRGIFNTTWPLVLLNTTSDSVEYKRYIEALSELQDNYNDLFNRPKERDTLLEPIADETKIYEQENDIKKLKEYIVKLRLLCKDKPPIHDTVEVEAKQITEGLRKDVSDRDKTIADKEAALTELTKDFDKMKDGRNGWRKKSLVTWAGLILVLLAIFGRKALAIKSKFF